MFHQYTPEIDEPQMAHEDFAYIFNANTVAKSACNTIMKHCHKSIHENHHETYDSQWWDQRQAMNEIEILDVRTKFLEAISDISKTPVFIHLEDIEEIIQHEDTRTQIMHEYWKYEQQFDTINCIDPSSLWINVFEQIPAYTHVNCLQNALDMYSELHKVGAIHITHAIALANSFKYVADISEGPLHAVYMGILGAIASGLGAAVKGIAKGALVVGKGIAKGAMVVGKVAVKGIAKGAKVAIKVGAKGAKLAAKGIAKGAKVAIKIGAKGAKLAAKGIAKGAKVAIKVGAKGAKLAGKAGAAAAKAIAKGAKVAIKVGKKIGSVVAKGAKKAGTVSLKIARKSIRIAKKVGTKIARSAKKAGTVALKAVKKVARKTGKAIQKGVKNVPKALKKAFEDALNNDGGGDYRNLLDRRVKSKYGLLNKRDSDSDSDSDSESDSDSDSDSDVANVHLF